MTSRIFTLIVVVLLGCTAHTAEIFVATNGSDAWSGKLAAPNAQKSDGPFATLERARDEIRKLKAAGLLREGATVQVRAGVYEFGKTFALVAGDSGTEQARIVYRAFDGERVSLIGGKQIANFQPYKGEILKADLAAQGMKGAPVRQLFFDGKRQPLARYPNEDAKNPVAGGWAYVDGKVQPLYQDIAGEDRRMLHFKTSDARTWVHPEDGEVFVFARYNWWNDIRRIVSVDAENHTITVDKDASYAMRGGDRYFVRGLFEELDVPGEWYFDHRTSTLYFWPPAPLGNKPIYVSRVGTIVEMNGVSNVTLRGFNIECCDGTAIVLKNATHCLIAANTIHNVGEFGGSAVSVDGRENGVVGNDISEVGNTGIVLGGGDRKTLTNANNFADNNYIHHVGVFYKQGVGIAMNGVGQRASHNLIHDTPRFAIEFGGNNQIIEYNHMRHLALETEDVGATYCGGRDWLTPRGSVIRYNFIHDVLGFGRVEQDGKAEWVSPYFAWGVYLDDNSGGVDVIGNIVARCGRASLHAHDARDCIVDNNIFVEAGLRQWEWDGWTTTRHFWKEFFPNMVKNYESVANEPAWKKMRGMNLHPKNAPDAEGRVMRGDIAERNILVWKNPDAGAVNTIAFSGTLNKIDNNIYWHFGEPLKTGIHKAGKAISKNLAPNPMLDGEIGKLPHDWQWQIHPRPDARAALVEDAGRRAIRIDAAFNHDKPRDNYPIIVSRDIELKPGATYRLRAKLRSDTDGTKTEVMVQFWADKDGDRSAHFWGSPNAGVALTTAWKDFESVFKIPAQGEKGWDERMKAKNFCVRFDWPLEKGAFFISEPSLEEVEDLSEWQAWQELGADVHSIVADPKFVDSAHDDYRLAPDSPAWKLGFKPIPVDKIGPYRDELRASWPIVEASGVREHPIVIPESAR